MPLRQCKEQKLHILITSSYHTVQSPTSAEQERHSKCEQQLCRHPGCINCLNITSQLLFNVFKESETKFHDPSLYLDPHPELMRSL